MFSANPADDRRADLKIAAPENKTLGTDGAEDQFRLGVVMKAFEQFLLVEITADRFAVGNGIHTQKRLVDAKPSCDCLHGAARTKNG